MDGNSEERDLASKIAALRQELGTIVEQLLSGKDELCGVHGQGCTRGF